jgi:hypothetical protein
MNFYKLELENDRLLNPISFVEFCINHQDCDIVLQVNNEGHCLRHTEVYKILDLFNFKSVTLRTWNILEQHDRYIIDHTNWNYWLTRISGYDLNFDYSWSGSKLFGCFYGRPSAPRLGIATHLYKNHRDNSLIKVKFDITSEDSRKLFDLARIYSWDPDSIDAITQITNLPEQSQIYEKGYWKTNNPMNYLYKDILIDIVSEPTCEGIAFYPTEKIVRPMLFKKPFIVMGSENYLIYLRQLGFKTFYESWDEDYDGYSGKERYFQILKVIDQISAGKIEIDPAILEHNQTLLLTQMYSRTVNRVFN